MSRSYRTQKTSIAAERNMARDASGAYALPSIIERAPAPGDRHPLPKRALAHLLAFVPVQYLWGLSRIELRARPTSRIGKPFAWYWVDERAVILYSLPMTMNVGHVLFNRGHFQRFGAMVESTPRGFTIAWPNTESLALWFYTKVLAHELGHHFCEQYRCKYNRIRSRRHDEAIADLHARRIADVLLKSF